MSVKNYLLHKRESFKEEYWPYYDMISAIICDAIKQRDVLFLVSSRCARYCELLDLDYEDVIERIPVHLKKKIKIMFKEG